MTGRSVRLRARWDVDVGAMAVLPGLVDSHVHVNEPGRTDWEGFTTASRAAAAGGITTLVDMPLNSIPPTVNVAALRQKRRAAAGQCFVDVAFWAGAVPGNLDELAGLRRAGVVGFKCFTCPSGVDEFPQLDWAELSRVLVEARRLRAVVAVHAEDDGELRAAAASPGSGSGTRYAAHLRSRPARAEELAVSRLARLAAGTRARTHVLHVSAANVLPQLRAAKAAGTPLTAETCPHYLALSAEQVPDGATEFKCCPPIREQTNAERLWQALGAGELDCVVSDHSPSPPSLKSANFLTAWGGIASLQLSLAVTWTAARTRGHSLAEVARWMAERPARLVRLRRKGCIAAGFDADLVVFDPDEQFVVDPGRLHHRHSCTPYAGKRLTGVVRQTWLRGEPAGHEPRGQLLAGEPVTP